MEPENRLVARTLERAWEEALSEQARLEAEYERVERARKARRRAPPSWPPIRDLTQDLPALWRAETTTQAERQTIVRLLSNGCWSRSSASTEKVRVECHWHGGSRTAHELTRPVARLASLSTYAALTARAAELRREGLDCAQIAEILNDEGWRPAKRRDTFNAPMVHHLLIKSGAERSSIAGVRRSIERRPNEWTIRELAEEIGMPQPTLYAWIQKGRLSCRNAGGGSKRAKLVLRRSRDGRGPESDPRHPAALAPPAAEAHRQRALPRRFLESRHDWSISTVQSCLYTSIASSGERCALVRRTKTPSNFASSSTLARSIAKPSPSGSLRKRR